MSTVKAIKNGNWRVACVLGLFTVFMCLFFGSLYESSRIFLECEKRAAVRSPSRRAWGGPIPPPQGRPPL